MPRVCPGNGCAKTVEPVAIEFHTGRFDGWFLACPVCHYVFGRVDDPPAGSNHD